MAEHSSLRAYTANPAVQPFEIPAKTYIWRAQIYGIVSASIIIHNERVLLVQRASDDEYPNLWEVPGGVADGDETIVQCAVRELREEVGLAASEVIGMIGEFGWIEKRPEGSGRGGQRAWKVFMFFITVEGNKGDLNVKLDPKEHQAYLWASEADIKKGSCGDIKLNWISDNQIGAILNAFELDRSKKGE